MLDKANELLHRARAATPFSDPTSLEEMAIELHIPTLNEENWIGETLDSLLRQELVENGDVTIRVLDSNSEDDTVRIAEEKGVDTYTVPDGKLTARHHGFLMAREDDADIVVSADSGDIYPKDWLNRLLNPFTVDRDVVATHGPLIPRDPLWMPVKGVFNNLWRPLVMINAGNSAIRTDAYFDIGGFRQDIDQTSLLAMEWEEEFKFLHKLRLQGRVHFVPTAVAKWSCRRYPITTEENGEYVKQLQSGIRF